MWEYIPGTLTAPVQTLCTVAERKLWKEGLLVVVLLSLLQGVSLASTMSNENILPYLEGITGTPGIEVTVAVLQSPYFLTAAAFFLRALQWVLAGVLFHLLARLFKGQGTLGGVLAATAFAGSPDFIGIPLAALASLAGGLAFLSGIVEFGTGIWTAVLGVIAIRENYRIGTGAAAAVFFIPFILLFIAALFLFGVLLAFAALLSLP